MNLKLMIKNQVTHKCITCKTKLLFSILKPILCLLLYFVNYCLTKVMHMINTEVVLKVSTFNHSSIKKTVNFYKLFCFKNW